MTQSFKKILSVKFNHLYYSDNRFKTIQIKYQNETNRLMINLGIVVKLFPGEMFLFCDNPELLQTSQDDVPLRFSFTCSDFNYINYTELPPFQLSKNILYFNNLNLKSSQTNSLQLHKNTFVDENEVIAVSTGTIEIPGYSTDKKFKAADAAGNEISLVPVLPGSGRFSAQNVQEGLVKVFEGENPAVQFYINNNPVWNKPLGILELYPGEIFKHFNDSGGADYEVSFSNRQTIWKYFFIDESFKKYNNLSIINKAKEEVFKTPVKQLFHNDMEALVFESKSRIPLSEYSTNFFQLVDGFDASRNSGKVIIKTLANASTDLIYSDDRNSTGTIYSHIYI